MKRLTLFILLFLVVAFGAAGMYLFQYVVPQYLASRAQVEEEGQVLTSRAIGGPGVDNPAYHPWVKFTNYSTAPSTQLATGGVYFDSGANCTGGDPCLQLYYDSAWNELTGGAGGDGAPTDATYITQTADDDLDAEQALSVLSTGLMKVTTGTGVVTSITDNSTNWTAAYNWGDHGSVGYLNTTSLDTEAELESQLGDVTDVYTNNDGTLADDDVTLTDIQNATSSDFHNIGGTDDDSPEIGDTIGSGTSGSVLFVDASAQLAQDNAAFFWLAASDYLGLSTMGPDRRLDVLDASNPQLRLTQADGTNYADLHLTPIGDLKINPSIYLGSIYMGWNAGAAADTAGKNNIGIGYGSLASVKGTGTSNVGIGSATLGLVTTGGNNLAIGSSSLGAITTTSNNVAVGSLSGRLATGSTNVFIGGRSGYNQTTPNGNIFIGYKAGESTTTAGRSLAICYDCDLPSATANYQMNIGSLLFSQGVDGIDTTVSTGNLGVGVVDPDTRLEVLYAGNQLKLSFDGTDNAVFAVDTAGNLTVTPSGATAKIAASTVFLTPTAQTIAAGNTIAADACSGLKQITSAGAVTTSTTNTFTAPAAANTGCCMDLVNTGASNITLDNNANFFSAGAADVVMTANDALRVCSNGTYWFQITPLLAN